MKTPINISEINIVLVKPDAGLIGFGSFLINHVFYVGNVGIFSRKDGSGIRLVYPKKHDIDCFHPIDRVTGEFITQAIQKKIRELWPDYLF